MAAAEILVVDDEPDIRHLLKDILEDEGYTVSVAENAAKARNLRERHPFDLILLDIWMPDVDGITLLKEWSTKGKLRSPVIMLSGHGTVETAVEATRMGAYDFLEKPLSLAKLLVTVQGALRQGTAQGENPALQREGARFFTPVGKSPLMHRTRETVERIARLEKPVLITGEGGSGKGVFARYMHDLSGRSAHPFLHVETTALSDQGLVALVGSRSGERGIFHEADHGTVYLSDIAELTSELQAALYSALKTGAFIPVGGHAQPLQCRVVAASRHDVAALSREGHFRADLYYLLETCAVHVPPLRKHVEDVPELLAFYVDRLVAEEQLPFRHFTVAAQNRLRQHDWPGNVRELKNLVRHLLVNSGARDIDVDEVIAAQQEAVGEEEVCHHAFRLPLREAREVFEKEYFEHLLRQHGGSVSRVAHDAGIERTHLYRKLRTLGIDPKKVGTRD